MTPGAGHRLTVAAVAEHQPVVSIEQAEGVGKAFHRVDELRLGAVGTRGLGGGGDLQAAQHHHQQRDGEHHRQHLMADEQPRQKPVGAQEGRHHPVQATDDKQKAGGAVSVFSAAFTT